MVRAIFFKAVPYLTGTAFTVVTKSNNLPLMKCKSGIWLDDLGIRAPCGQCMHCRVNQGRKWSARIIMEWLFSTEYPYFLSFTVAPEHATGSLDKKYFHIWIKTQQKAIGRFRYYAVGEYGDESGREHYHMAIFPEHPAQISAIASRWTKGFVSKSILNHARARYLANYTGKKLTKKSDQRLKPGQEPEFRSSSRNPPLGTKFCEAFIRLHQKGKGAAYLAKRGDIPRCFRVDGKIYPIGDWALTKIRSDLGIPLTHAGRKKANPEYETYHPLEGAEWNPEEAITMEATLNAKKKQKRLRGESPKI